jgi:hypothetical protein
MQVVDRLRNHSAWRALNGWRSKVDRIRHNQDTLQSALLNRARSFLAAGWFRVCISVLCSVCVT